MRIIDEGGHSLCRANANSRDASQASDGRKVLRLMVQLLLDTLHLADERLDLFEQKVPPQLLRSRRQGQLAEPGQTLFRPQTGLPRGHDACAAQQRANRILGPCPLGNHLVAAVDQLTPGSYLCRGHMHRRRLPQVQ
ncbi:MAG: hypothetical protein ABSH35_33395 [Isosphaeraceae bacterium]|jgi:hypothetical protein